MALGRDLERDQVTGAPDWATMDAPCFQRCADTGANDAYCVSQS